MLKNHLTIELHRTAKKLEPLKGLSEVEIIGEESEPVYLAQYIREAVSWAWLKWHVSQNRNEINSRLGKVVSAALKRKATKTFKKAPINDRGEFDHFLLTAALLSGNNELAQSVAATVSGANAQSKQFQYDAALAGFVAAIVLGKHQIRDAQLAIMMKFKPTRVNAFPTHGLVKAIVEGSGADVNRAIASAVKKYWSDSSVGRTSYRGRPTQLLYEDDSRLGFDLNQRSLHWMWPYMEATFARLAMLNGRKISYDDFWFPLPLVTGLDANAPSGYTVKTMPDENPIQPRPSRRTKALIGALLASMNSAPVTKKRRK